MENYFEKADFCAGSDHKERLRKVLFAASNGDKGAVSQGELSDDELDMAAGGKKYEKSSRIF